MPEADAEVVAKLIASPLISKRVEPLLETIYYLLQNGSPRSEVIVFDIDDTLLFNPTDAEVLRSRNAYLAFRNKHIAEVYDTAKNMGYPVYFITARANASFNKILDPRVMESNATRTKKQLAQLGMDASQNNLILRPLSVDSTREQVGVFKKSSRALVAYTDADGNLRQRPKTILLNFGDQWSDHLSASEAEFNTLRRVFRGFNVLFRPDPEKEPFTKYAVKLTELREK